MRLALFDIDGTLLRGHGSGRMAMERAFAEVFDLPAAPDLDGRLSLGGALDPHIIRDIARLLDIDPAELHRRRERVQEKYVVHLRGLIDAGATYTLLPGVRELLDELTRRRHDIRLGLLTGNLEAGAREKLRTHGLSGYFAGGGFGEDGDTRAEVAHVARRRLAESLGEDIPPSRVWVIGDTSRDVECGRLNGFRTVAVATGWSSREELRSAGADVVLDDLADTARVADLLTGARGCAGTEHDGAGAEE